MDVPSPLEWHPAYRDKAWLIDWLDRATSPSIQLPVLPAAYAALTEDSSPVAPAFKVRTLTRRRCAGPAPYVGRPFIYVWEAAVDDLGRTIAGESERLYK